MTHHNFLKQNNIVFASENLTNQGHNANILNSSQVNHPFCHKQNASNKNCEKYEIKLSGLNDQSDKNNLANNQQKTIDCLRLIRSENIGVFSFWRLIEFFGSASTAVKEADNFFKKLNLKKKPKIASLDLIEKELEDTEKFGAKIISFFDENYPKALQKIFDCPPVIAVKGDISLFKHNSISIVGSRNCSFNGANIAKKIAVEFGQNSFITVSGLARGIDSAVHEASILSGTIGVIAGGINSIYPYENRRLYQQISEVGLLISEMPFNAPPKSNYFIRRNRIISGLSSSLIVIEASAKSGSLATARFALEQGREVFACAGSPFDPRCSGVNQLIKDGANIINNLDHLIDDVKNVTTNFQKSLTNQISSPKISSQNPKNDFFEKINYYSQDLESLKLFTELLTDAKHGQKNLSNNNQIENPLLINEEPPFKDYSTLDLNNSPSQVYANNDVNHYSIDENFNGIIFANQPNSSPENTNSTLKKDDVLIKKNKAKSIQSKNEVIIIGKVKNYANNNCDNINKNSHEINLNNANFCENKSLENNKFDIKDPKINPSPNTNSTDHHNSQNYHYTLPLKTINTSIPNTEQDNNVSNDISPKYDLSNTTIEDLADNQIQVSNDIVSNDISPKYDLSNTTIEDLAEKQMQIILDNIFAKINHNPIAIDEIIQQLNLPAQIINVALVQLELSGKISVNHGKVYGESKLLYG